MEHQSSSLLIHNADLAGNGTGWLAVCAGIISGSGSGSAPESLLQNAEKVIDARGMLLMPGAIDCHVHMRQPGLTHKADIDSETRAARAGGVTSVMDMPNTVPQTTDAATLREKQELLREYSHVNYAAFVGATTSNAYFLSTMDTRHIPGVKLFMGSSTGNMLVADSAALNHIFSICADRNLPLCVHAEDEEIIKAQRTSIKEKYAGTAIPVFEHTSIRPVEACVRATTHALELAAKHGTHLHVAHLTTAREVELICQARRKGVNVTCEVSPHHLLFCSDMYSSLGSRIKMNPAVKSMADCQALRAAAAAGIIDMVATDHAPHLPAEKEGDALTAASGAPMVQFALPVLLDLFPPQTVARLYSHGPARVYGVEGRGGLTPGLHADLVLVQRLAKPHVITDADVLSKCGWTPLAGYSTSHRVHTTILSGTPSALTFRH